MKKEFNFLIISIFLLFMMSCACSKNAAKDNNNEEIDTETNLTFVQKHGALQVKGTSLLDAEGNPIVLRGVSLGWHNWWPRFFNAEAIHTLANEWKCTLVRIPLGVEPDGAYLDNPELGEQCVNAAVEACIKEGIYCIIDWHSHHIRTEEALKFFSKMAFKYGDVPNVIFEIFNEPDNTTNWPDVKAYSEEVIKTIRDVSPTSIILVGNPYWDQKIRLCADDPIENVSNIMYTVHFYAGTHKQELRDETSYALSKGLPVFISECAGMGASGGEDINQEEWQKWLAFMAENNLSYDIWSLTDKENETCSMLLPSASDGGPWPDEDLNTWGKIVKSLIIFKNSNI